MVPDSETYKLFSRQQIILTYFAASNGSSHIASNHFMHHSQGHVQSHFKQSNRNISRPQGMSVTVIRTMLPSSSRCLAAMRATCRESGHARKHAETCTHQAVKQKHISPSRNVGHRHKNDATLIQHVPGSNASDMQRKWSCKEHAETCKHQASDEASWICWRLQKCIVLEEWIRSLMRKMPLQHVNNSLTDLTTQQRHACTFFKLSE